MIEPPSHLVRLPGRRVRVLRLIIDGKSCWPFDYEVAPGERMCRKCGCTDVYGCPGGCAWVTETHDLCSRCFTKGMLL